MITKNGMKKWLTLLVVAVSVASVVVPTIYLRVNAQEGQETVEITKNATYLALEREVEKPAFKLAEARAENSVEESQDLAEYLLDTYDGAMLRSSAGFSQRIQNGGWNVYYNTAKGKQLVRSGYNAMFATAAAKGAISVVIGGLLSKTGVAAIAGAALLLKGIVYGVIVSRTKYCRDQVDAHGNTGTARITLTEARWSSKYDNRW